MRERERVTVRVWSVCECVWEGETWMQDEYSLTTACAFANLIAVWSSGFDGQPVFESFYNLYENVATSGRSFRVLGTKLTSDARLRIRFTTAFANLFGGCIAGNVLIKWFL